MDCINDRRFLLTIVDLYIDQIAAIDACDFTMPDLIQFIAVNIIQRQLVLDRMDFIFNGRMETALYGVAGQRKIFLILNALPCALGCTLFNVGP